MAYTLPMPIKTGIIGLGYWGPNLLRTFGADADCEMVWGCDLNLERHKKLQRQYPAVKFTTDVDDLLSDKSLDLILIATPTATHFSLAKKVLEAGKHVFIEKPMARTTKEADTLLKLAKKKKKQIFVDHTFVFAPAVQEMARMAKKELGELRYFDSTRINLGLIQKDINVLWDLAIHDLSILSAFLNLNDVTEVAAHGAAYVGKQEEVAHLHMTFQSGFSAHVHVSWLSPVKLRSVILCGSKAMVTYDDTEPSEKLRVYDKGVEHGKTKADLSAVAPAGAKADPFFPVYRSGDIRIPALPSTETLSLEAHHVMACLQGKEKPRASGEHGRSVVAILEAADKSLKLKRTVSLRTK